MAVHFLFGVYLVVFGCMDGLCLCWLLGPGLRLVVFGSWMGSCILMRFNGIVGIYPGV